MNKFKPFPEHEEVHVISDIHMGGKSGFQILRETKRLAGYITWVANHASNDKVALVLNGDVFDTLAEDSEGYVAMENAVATIERIMEDDSFKVVWDALSYFVSIDQRTLVFIVGNHDIEMAFPTVQSLILWRLSGEDLTKRARVVFSTTGAGYTCFVGDAKVYCTHGNEVDAWNYNRYEDLAKVSRRLNADRPLDPKEWAPNAGTRMVKEVMNEVKKTYKWIDLLKPETNAAIGTLVVLDPAQTAKIAKLVSIVGEKMQGSKQIDQRLSTEGFKQREEIDTTRTTINQLLGSNLMEGIKVRSLNADEMYLQAEINLGLRDALLAPDEELGTAGLIWDRLTGRIRDIGKDEALRRALLDWLKDDKTFNLKDQDDTFKDVSTAVGSSVDFIVTGHTHLERAIDMGGNRFYFNCGTWIRLLKFSQAMLNDSKSFKPVFDLLSDESGQMKSIDDARFPDEDGVLRSFVLDQTSAVIIKKDNGKVIGQLTHVTGDGTSAPTPIETFKKA